MIFRSAKSFRQGRAALSTYTYTIQKVSTAVRVVFLLHKMNTTHTEYYPFGGGGIILVLLGVYFKGTVLRNFFTLIFPSEEPILGPYSCPKAISN